MAAQEDNKHSTKGPLLTDVFRKNPDLIEQLALCLDREMRPIPNWKHLSQELKVDAYVITRLEQYSDFSPTIRLFQYLEVTQPDLTIRTLKQALIDLSRNDLVSLLTTKAGCVDSKMVKEVFTSSDVIAPRISLLDDIALALDEQSKVWANWSSLALKLGVPRQKLKQFERRSTQSPTYRLFEYLEATHPQMTLKTLKDALELMGRKDLLRLLRDQTLPDEVLIKDAVIPGSELFQTVEDELNIDHVPGTQNWRHLACRLQIPSRVYQEFDGSLAERKSPTKEVLQLLVKRSPELTLIDVIEALEKIQRNDAIQIITQRFPGAVVTRIFKQLQEMHCDADKVDKKTSLSNDLEKIASDKGFIISGNPASGNCMFYALCEQLRSVKGIKLSHTELRKTLVQFLTENSIQQDGTPLFNFVSGYPTWREYWTSMSKDGTWGDHLVLLAAANYCRTDIRVISSLGREVLISPDRPVNTNPLVLGHIHEEHYVSLHPKHGPAASIGTGNLPCLTARFIGRQEVVDEIIEKLTQVPCPLRMIIIVALPGMGKTQVAIRVSHDLLLSYKKTVIFIEKQENLTDVCYEILSRLSEQDFLERQSLVAIAKRKLKELQHYTVIVLDGTEDIQRKEFDDFAEYLVKYAPKVQLIITSQEDVSFKSLDIHKVPLAPLDSDSSARLLQVSVVDCQDYAKELGELCGGIPLLLVNCVCLLQNSYNPAVLIEGLRDNPIRLLKKNAKDVYNALGRFFCKFPKSFTENLIAVSVFPSAFSAEDIEFLFDDKQEAETVKTKMVKCSLVRKMGNGKFILHPLVRDYCRAERKLLKMEAVGEDAQYKFNHHYLELLTRVSKQFISKESALDAIPAFRNEKANIMEALKNCLQDKSSANGFGIDVANSPEVMGFLAKVLSPPAECTKLYERCRDIAEDSGDQKRLAESLNSLGFRRLCDVAHRRGDRDTLQIFQKAYDIRMKLPEEQHKCETHANTICKLGLCYSLQGEEEKGRKLIQEGIDMRKSLGFHLYAAAGYCDLGNTYRECGDHQKAIDIWENKTLPVYREQLGDHPWTASILRYMAGSYKALADGTSEPKNVELAIKYSRKALELRRKLLGVHQDTARSHVDLSDLLVIQKEFKEGLGELEKALEIQRDVFGEQHKSTMDTLAKKMRILSIVQSGTK